MTAVIFHVGGVLIDWNPRYLYRKFFKGDADGAERFLSEVCTPAWNHRQDEGRSWAEAVAELTACHPEHAALIAAYDQRWEEMVLGVCADTIAIVNELRRRGTALYCLTNFSDDKFRLVRRRYDVFDLFDGIVVSAEVGCAKPDLAIFRHLLARFNLKPEQCVFIDDVPANIAAAQRLGFAVHLFRIAECLRADLVSRGLL